MAVASANDCESYAISWNSHDMNEKIYIYKRQPNNESADARSYCTHTHTHSLVVSIVVKDSR